MKTVSYTFVANWKMGCSFKAATRLAKEYADHCDDAYNAHIVICPSFDALASCAQILENTQLALGAQTVSPYSFGPHTGQVCAESLAEIGCKYAIIGHSERRQECHETNEQIANQALQLIAHGITPIICLGETAREFEDGLGASVMQTQLKPIFTALASAKNPIIFAYEPVWAIGTGVIPETEYLSTMFSWLKNHIESHLPHHPYTLLYGGSVSDTTIKSLKAIQEIHGFLIGSASLDFQKFQKIVSLWYTK